MVYTGRIKLAGIFLLTVFIIMVFILSYSGIDLDDSQEFINASQHSVMPKNGFVPDSLTAVKIAEAIWFPIYGDKIYEKRPFDARLLKDSIWIVKGTLSGDKKIVKGGVPYIEIQKWDCKVIKVTHGK